MKAVVLLSFMLALTQFTMAQEKKIVFVCQHGSAKSIIAATYFNKLAKERNLPYVAECRGIDPDSVVSVSAREGLAKDHMLDPHTKPQKLLAADTANVDRMILFCPLPQGIDSSIKTENWSQTENIDAEYPKRRDAIVKKIVELLDTLEKQ